MCSPRSIRMFAETRVAVVTNYWRCHSKAGAVTMIKGVAPLYRSSGPIKGHLREWLHNLGIGVVLTVF